MDQATQSLEEKLSSGCASCGHTIIEPGYPTPLCKDCRTKFIRFPIPLPIKIFAGAVALALLVSMYRLPGNFSVAVHYKRGTAAVKNRNYLTAQKELGEVIKRLPGYDDAKEYQAIAAYYNQDLSTFVTLVNQLQGKEVKNESLYGRINNLVDRLDGYVPADSLMNLCERYHSFDSIPDSSYRRYIANHNSEQFAAARYATFLLDHKQYHQCDSILDALLHNDPEYFHALSIKTGLKRELHEFDSAHYYCDRILQINHESAYGIASKARTYFKEKKDAEGMKWALKDMDLRKDDAYSLATLALAYHLTNNTVERDKLVDAAKKDSTQTESMQYITDIISGKEKFR